MKNFVQNQLKSTSELRDHGLVSRSVCYYLLYLVICTNINNNNKYSHSRYRSQSFDIHRQIIGEEFEDLMK